MTPLELESVVKDCLETHFPTHMDLIRILSLPILAKVEPRVLRSAGSEATAHL